MKIASTVVGMLTGMILISSVGVVIQHQQAYAPRDCAGCAEFRKLTREFVQNVIIAQESPNSEDVGQFRILTAQFERAIINAVLNDHLYLIPGIVSDYKQHLLEFGVAIRNIGDADAYIGGVLRIFCKPCI